MMGEPRRQRGQRKKNAGGKFVDEIVLLLVVWI